MKNYTPFVIFATPRTGTTLLWSYLNSHSSVICLKSVFELEDKINFSKYYPFESGKKTMSELIELRNDVPEKLLDELIFRNYEASIRAVGFKYFYDNDKFLYRKNSVLSYFKKMRDMKFIHIFRKNKMETLFSFIKAKNTNLWNIYSDKTSIIDLEHRNYKLRIDAEECLAYFEKIERQEEKFDLLFPNRTIKLCFEDLVFQPDRELKKVQNHLNINQENLCTQTQRVNRKKLSEVVINFSELKRNFKNTKYRKYFED